MFNLTMKKSQCGIINPSVDKIQFTYQTFCAVHGNTRVDELLEAWPISSGFWLGYCKFYEVTEKVDDNNSRQDSGDSG